MKPLPLLAALSLLTLPAGAADPPKTGKGKAEFEPLDKVVLDFMATLDAQSATVAVSKDGKVLHSRGFGYADGDKKKTPTPPDALLRIASCTKPITAALVKHAVADRKLALDAKAVELLGLKLPKGADARLADITVAHLLAHQGGWEWEKTFDPMFQIAEVEKEVGKSPAKTIHVVQFMLARPLQFDPGTKTAYSNFGYCMLARVLEKGVKKTYAEYLSEVICKPLGTTDIRVGYSSPKKRDAREVRYPKIADEVPLDTLDAAGGLVASAPALCQFLDAYWVTGDPRKPGDTDGQGVFFGSLPGTTAMTRQRPDGYNVVVLLNNRRDKYIHDDNDSLKKAVDKAIDELVKK